MKRTELHILLTAWILLFNSNYSMSQTSNDGYVSNYDFPSDATENNSSTLDDSNADYNKNSTSVVSISDKRSVEKVDEDRGEDIDTNDDNASNDSSYQSRLPQEIEGYGEKVILVNPKVHAWGAYTAEGKLIRAGLASAGAKWCSDINRACRTKVGVFRIFSLGDRDCISTRYPFGKGGAPMPYCMYFNNNQGIHGSNELAEGNISHGCVRVGVNDAKWIRYNFANIGTKIVILSY